MSVTTFGVSCLRSCASSVIIQNPVHATTLPQRFWLLIRAKHAEVTSTSTSIDDEPFRTSATAPHGRPVKVDQTSNETAAESVRNDKLTRTGLDEIPRSNSGSYIRAGR